MGPDSATSLQESVGNEALNAMLADVGRVEGPELEEEQEQEQEQEQDQDQDQESDTGMDEGFSDLLGSLGARESMVASADVQDWERMFGGDPDEEPPPERRVHRIPDALKPPVQPAQADAALAPKKKKELALALPPLGELGQAERDERFDALWAWLRDPYAAVDPGFEPESLVDDEGSLARVTALSRFVRGHFRSPLARAMASLGRPLPGGPGMAGQVARAGAVVELGALCEPVVVEVANRACAAALETDAPVHARSAARLCMEERKLRADLVTEVALYAEAEHEPDLLPLPSLDERAEALLAAGLAAAACLAPIPNPGRHAERSRPDNTGDASTAELDALLMELTGGQLPSNEVDYEVLGPILKGADNQLLFAGRAQVELAAAGIALRRVAGRGAREPVRHLLFAVDRELRDIAKSTARASQHLERLIGDDLDNARAEIHTSELELDALAARLRRVREAAIEALGTRFATPRRTGEAPAFGVKAGLRSSLIELERCELVGSGLTRAKELEAGVPALVGLDRARGRLRQGERLRREGDPLACRVLADAARLALIEGDPELDWRARAATVRALAQLGRVTDAAALMPRLERDGQGLELELARAELNRPGAQQTLARHLSDPTPAGHAHDWLEGHMLVAEAFSNEARWELADRHWAAAQAIAHTHGQPTAELSMMRAATLRVCGRPAQVHLESALASELTQVQLAASLILAGEHLDAGRSQHAIAAAERAWGLAIFRRSWHAFACAAIDRAAALEQMGHDGLPVLSQALALCRLQGEPGALLQARLMELTPEG